VNLFKLIRLERPLLDPGCLTVVVNSQTKRELHLTQSPAMKLTPINGVSVVDS
jgi:hypothetical protein